MASKTKRTAKSSARSAGDQPMSRPEPMRRTVERPARGPRRIKFYVAGLSERAIAEIMGVGNEYVARRCAGRLAYPTTQSGQTEKISCKTGGKKSPRIRGGMLIPSASLVEE
jgi:hypothetical protein